MKVYELILLLDKHNADHEVRFITSDMREWDVQQELSESIFEDVVLIGAVGLTVGRHAT